MVCCSMTEGAGPKLRRSASVRRNMLYDDHTCDRGRDHGQLIVIVTDSNRFRIFVEFSCV